MRRTPRAVAIAVSVMLLGSSAAAQDKEADAERLFREGQKLMEERRFGEACPKFEAAYAKDRQLGTLLNLAFCHKEQGSTWYAWLEFREAELKAGELKRFDRRDFARERLNELERSLPKVAVDVPKKLALTDVLVEDKRVPEAEHGTMFTVEEGKRKFTFKARGKKSLTVLVPIGRTGDKLHRVAVPEMQDGEDEPVAPPPPPPPPPAPPPPPEVKVVQVEAPGSPKRTAGFVALSVAGTAFVVGSVTGVLALTNACASNPIHTKSGCTDSAQSTGETMGHISEVSFAASGVAAVLGIYFLVTAPKEPARAAWVRPAVAPGWAGLTGAF